VAGVVAKVGPNVENLAVGDRVAASVDGFSSGNLDHCAFQTYSIGNTTATGAIPSSMSFEHAAVFPTAIGTTSVAFFDLMGLPRPPVDGVPDSDRKRQGILIWGGSSSVGSVAIQVAHLMGFTVFTVASEQHHALLRSLGADEVFDYHSADVESSLLAAAARLGTPISHALDAVSQASTLDAVSRVLKESSGKDVTPKLTHTLPLAMMQGYNKPEGEEMLWIQGERLWAEELRDLCVWVWNDFLPEALARGKVVPSPKPRVFDGGLRQLQEALNTLKAGVSGEKLVIKLV
jgi:NADPH:quinone reductase-like Zn-dependent oxidoreductase